MQNKISDISFTSNVRFIKGKGFDKIANMPKTVYVSEMRELGKAKIVNKLANSFDLY